MKRNSFVIFFIMLLLLGGCYRMRSSKGGGQTDNMRRINAADIALPPEFKIEAIAQGLTFPTAVVFDDQNNLYIIEAGYSYGEVWKKPALIRVNDQGKNIIVEGDRNGPWTSAQFHNGAFYISEGGHASGGKILRITKDGNVTPLVEHLPSVGDHHTNMLVVHDGYIYFGQGTATNSAVVGADNAAFGWLERQRDFHDIPCDDVVLSGQNFESENVLDSTSKSKVSTGAYSAFGKATKAGQVIPGQVPCNGAIMRVPVQGGPLEVFAWGLRNPYGLAVSPEGKLYTTENSYDDRGSRPVWGTGDVLWEVTKGSWYGWPDYSAGQLIDRESFSVPGKERPRRVLQTIPQPPPKPVAVLGVHSSSNGFDFSTNKNFGFNGEAFIAQFGDMAPAVGKVLSPVGFKVVRVNIKNGVVRDFAVNKGKRNGPATWLNKGGLERPVAASFSPDGSALYIVDFGVVQVGKDGPRPIEKTGVIWKISRR